VPVEEEVLTPEELQLPNDVQARLRIGRTAERKAEALEAQVKQMERQQAVERAGVPDHPARDVVFENYDGPLDSAAILAHAEKFGIGVPATDGVTADDISGQRQILSASGGSTPTSSGDIDAADAMRNAGSKEEVLGIVSQIIGQPGFKGVWPEPI
jgi:hypothetical protein